MVHTSRGDYAARAVVNAAGVFADEVHNWVCADKLHITPRRGEYCLLDHTAGGHVSRTVFQLPGKYGKGVLVSPTVHGNLLLGPTAKDIGSREDTATTAQGLQEVLEKSRPGGEEHPPGPTLPAFLSPAWPACWWSTLVICRRPCGHPGSVKGRDPGPASLGRNAPFDTKNPEPSWASRVFVCSFLTAQAEPFALGWCKPSGYRCRRGGKTDPARRL